MKVLMLSERWFPTVGGGEEHIRHLSRELVKLGCEITLISRSLISHDKRAPETETLYGGKFTIHRLMPTTEFESLVGRASYIPFSMVKSIASKEKFDIVHAQSFSACLTALMLKKMYGKPALCTVHGIYQDAFNDLTDSKSKAELYKKIERFVLFRDYDRIITVDKHFVHLAEKFGYPLEKVNYIANGVDIESFPVGKKERMGNFLFVGRLVPQKGLEYLIRASKILKDKGMEHQVLLVGDGPLKQSLQEIATKLGLGANTKFLGRIPRDELISTYSSSGFFVLPSLWEGLPITLLEAWAAGLPLIATKVGGIPDVCIDGENSILIEPKDPDALADGMSLLFNDKNLAVKIGANGRALVEQQFTWQKVAEKTLKVYKELV